LVLGPTIAAAVALSSGGRTVVVDNGSGVAWDATYQVFAATSLAAAAAVVVTAVFVHADSSRPSVLSWAALAVAVLAWVLALPLWWEVVGRDAPIPFLGGSTGLVPVWMVMTGVSALAERRWHRWLAVLTVLTGIGLLFLSWVPLLGGGMPAVWAVAFAVAQVVGPHPRAGVASAAEAGAATAMSTSGHATISPGRTGRWYRTPSGAIRLLSGVGPPVAVAATFLFGWVTVSQGTEAPTGDTSFTWMPMGVIAVCGLATLIGFAALSVQTARAAAVSASLFWLSTVWLYPAGFVEDGFPQSAKGMMIFLSVLSLLPTAVVCWWAALGDDTPEQRPSWPHPRADSSQPRRWVSPPHPRADSSQHPRAVSRRSTPSTHWPPAGPGAPEEGPTSRGSSRE
jgi:hypothetical protein